MNKIFFPSKTSTAETLPPLPPCPSAPFGIPRLRTGFSLSPVIVAVASLPDGKVSTVPIVKFGVTPFLPSVAFND